jgi:hypothetical protein
MNKFAQVLTIAAGAALLLACDIGSLGQAAAPTATDRNNVTETILKSTEGNVPPGHADDHDRHAVHLR